MPIDIINPSDGDNLGSILRLVFLRTRDVATFPPVVDNMIEFSDITYISPPDLVGWHAFIFTNETAEFTEPRVLTEEGYVSKQSIEMKVAQTTLERLQRFSAMEYERFLVVFEDANNFLRICGYVNQRGEMTGMRFNDGNSTGKRVADKNGYQCSFNLNSPERAVHLLDATNQFDALFSDIYPWFGG